MDIQVEDSRPASRERQQQLAAASAQEAISESLRKEAREAAETAVQALGAVSGGRG